MWYGTRVDADHTVPQASTPDGFRTRSPFYSPRVLEKVLPLMDFINEREDEHIKDLLRLAFAATMVDYSNYSYEPSLGRKATVGRPEVEDFPVIATLAKKLEEIADDSDWYRENRTRRPRTDGTIHVRSFLGDDTIEPGRVHLIITSPPYMNDYHYNRNTRPHLYLLEFCQSPGELKHIEALNFGTSWQLAREQKKVELDPIINDTQIRQTVEAIRRQRPEKGIYGGRGWANYAASYLNDCVRFMMGAQRVLGPRGTALVVIGNSIVQGIPVPTDKFLASIALRCGLTVPGIHTPRDTRVWNSIINSNVRTAKAGNRTQLYESVVEIRQLP